MKQLLVLSIMLFSSACVYGMKPEDLYAKLKTAYIQSKPNAFQSALNEMNNMDIKIRKVYLASCRDYAKKQSDVGIYKKLGKVCPFCLLINENDMQFTICACQSNTFSVCPALVRTRAYCDNPAEIEEYFYD